MGDAAIGRVTGGLQQLRDMRLDPDTYADYWKYLTSKNLMSPASMAHADVYNRLGDDLRRQYGGKSGSITDMAKNYGGAWDYAMRDPEDAARLAQLYQFLDYVRGSLDSESQRDAGYDLEENLSGVRDALRFVGPPDPYDQLKARSVQWAKGNPRR